MINVSLIQFVTLTHCKLYGVMCNKETNENEIIKITFSPTSEEEYLLFNVYGNDKKLPLYIAFDETYTKGAFELFYEQFDITQPSDKVAYFQYYTLNMNMFSDMVVHQVVKYLQLVNN